MALLEDGVVVELGVEHRSEQSVLHGIYRGRVQRVVPSTQAAFLDIGLHRNAFLQIDQVPQGALDAWREEGRVPPADKGGARNGSGSGEPGLRLENLLRAGQPVLVQVVREPLGPKGLQGQLRSQSPGAVLRLSAAGAHWRHHLPGHGGTPGTAPHRGAGRAPEHAQGRVGSAFHRGTARRGDARGGHHAPRSRLDRDPEGEPLGSAGLSPGRGADGVPLHPGRAFVGIQRHPGGQRDSLRTDGELHPPVPARYGAQGSALLAELSDL